MAKRERETRPEETVPEYVIGKAIIETNTRITRILNETMWLGRGVEAEDVAVTWDMDRETFDTMLTGAVTYLQAMRRKNQELMS